MGHLDFHEDYAAPQPDGTTIEAKFMVSKRGDRRVTVELSAFNRDGEQFCDQQIEFSSVEFAKFLRLGHEATKCAGDFQDALSRLEVVT